MAGEDFGAAAQAYDRLAQYAPEDPQALAMAAQARFLASDRELDPAAQLYAERALAVDPRQRTALGLLGMASFESGAFAAAANYWERLRALEDPASPAYEMLDSVIAMARERAGLPATAQEPAEGRPDSPSGPGISVTLRLADATPADPSATVFVFARPATQAGGMPIAVRRLTAAELPVTLRLTDSDAMAGQRLSEAGSVMVSAQLSANGQPGEANALATGIAGPIEAGGSDVLVTIELGGDAASG
jgi:cytochrome c-type biogenesis protein CcmH